MLVEAVYFFIVVSLSDGSGQVYSFQTKESCMIQESQWRARPDAITWLVTPCTKHPDE